MKLERFTLALRPRRSWEAFDLGLVVARQWRFAALKAWLCTYGVWLLFMMALQWTRNDLAWVLLWWLKPAFDRVLLFVFSRAVFDDIPKLRETLHAFPGLLWRSRLWADLSYRRFAVDRPFYLPVVQLEGQRGKGLRQRMRILGRGMSGYLTWLTVCCSNFVALLYLSTAALLALLAPVGSPYGDLLGWMFSGTNEHPLLMSAAMLLWGLAETIIEPYFVAAGFCLYLNRRSELEGWDIELVFRRLGNRLAEHDERTRAPQQDPHLQPTGPGKNIAGLLLAVGLAASGGMLLASPPRAVAAEALTVAADSAGASSAVVIHASSGALIMPIAPPAVLESKLLNPPGLPDRTRVPASERVAPTLKKILADPVFGSSHEEMQWALQITPEKKKDEPPSNLDWLNWVAKLFKGVAYVIRILIYFAIVFAIGLVIVLLYRFRDRWVGPLAVRRRPPEMLFGLDVRPSSLPDDVAAAAQEALAAGDVIKALSLLYRGSLVVLIRRDQIDFHDGDTEENCLERVNGRVPEPLFSYFSSLLAAWQSTAYAHRNLPFNELAALCQGWPAHFRPQSATLHAEVRT